MIFIKKYSELEVEEIEKVQGKKVFLEENYYNYINSEGGDVWYAMDNNYILPIVISKKRGFYYASFPCETCVIENGKEKVQEVEFLDEVQKILKKNGIAWTISSASALFDIYPSYSRRIPFGSHVIDLTKPEDEIWGRVHSKHRNSIRRAEKNDVKVKFGREELLKDYIILDNATWKRSGRKSYGNIFFKNILASLKNNTIIFVAYKDGLPQAGACIFYNKEMGYYMYGASADRPEAGSANYLQWEIIRYLKGEGVKSYSFVGCRINEDKDSKYHDIQRFKERFGGMLIQGYMFKTILSPWKYHVFCFAYRIKHGNLFMDPIEQEISKWKELNS